MTYMWIAFPSLRQWVGSRVSITVILAGFLAITQAHADAGITGNACVVDGDSLAVGGVLKEKWCRGGVEVRISGIDAPEWNQTCTDAGGKEWTRGQAAKRAVARMVEGKIVVCQERARDSYKRSVAVCLAAAESTSHNAVRSGLPAATPMTIYIPQMTRHTINPGADRLQAAQTPPWPGLIGRI
jgi:endonuclease YncB( thermonuclease family)